MRNAAWLVCTAGLVLGLAIPRARNQPLEERQQEALQSWLTLTKNGQLILLNGVPHRMLVAPVFAKEPAPQNLKLLWDGNGYILVSTTANPWGQDVSIAEAHKLSEGYGVPWETLDPFTIKRMDE